MSGYDAGGLDQAWLGEAPADPCAPKAMSHAPISEGSWPDQRSASCRCIVAFFVMRHRWPSM
eukprot:3370081-Amphidinium_carterae.1